MINIHSISCSLALAPYLVDSLTEFSREGGLVSRVVRQGGAGFIVRCDGDIVLRHQNRQATLSREDARHYLAGIEFRLGFYDVLRMQDEVVLANVGDEILLSHPQSEIWLGRAAVAALAIAFNSESSSRAVETPAGLPDWLSISLGGGRLLLSDRRTARWVLLGADHIRELERRLDALRAPVAVVPRLQPPTISLKGLVIHLQSAFKLADTLEEFANTGNVSPFEESTPIYSLTACRATEGIELKDSNNRVAITSREARKWAGVIRAELDGLNAGQVERGGIRTVFAGTTEGRWILQWGDEVFVPATSLSDLSPSASRTATGMGPSLVIKLTEEFLLMLSPKTGACVALTASELESLEWASE